MSTADDIQQLLRLLGLGLLPIDQAEQLACYVEVLLRWNAKMNLTAVRSKDEIVRRHLSESIQCARSLPPGVTTLLDYGSGGGLPGLPCAICRPEIEVTLAESQGKKAAFLREVTRALALEVGVYSGRVEDMAAHLLFDVVTLRAVDHMREACRAATGRLRPGGWLVIMTTEGSCEELTLSLPGMAWRTAEKLAGSDKGMLLLGTPLVES